MVIKKSISQLQILIGLSLTITLAGCGRGVFTSLLSSAPDNEPSPEPVASLSITSPNDGANFATATQSQIISGICSTNAVNLSARVGTTSLSFSDEDCSDGTWALNSLTLSAGANAFEISATNRAGVSVSDSLTITQGSAPSLRITSPGYGVSHSVTTGSQTVSGTCESTVTSISSNVGTFSDSDCSDGTWVLVISTLSSQTNVITITATGANGVSSSTSFTLTYCSSVAALTEASDFSGGTGTSGDPYLISTAAELSHLRGFLNDSSKYFKLTQDIDLACLDWSPIGGTAVSTSWWLGHFDGANKTISNLYVSQAGDYAGLFGAAGGAFSISNLNLKNATVTGGQYSALLVGSATSIAAAYPTFSSITLTGVLVGSNSIGALTGTTSNGSISSVSFEGTVSGASYVGGLIGKDAGTGASTRQTLSATAKVTSSSNYIGGIMSNVTGSVTYNDLSFTGSITGGGTNGGGIVGYGDSSTIERGAASANLSGSGMYWGGICGRRCNIDRSHFSGDISVSSTSVGGILGGADSTLTVTKSYATGSISGTSYVGGLVGNTFAGFGPYTISDSYAQTSVTGTSFIGGLIGRLVGGGTMSKNYVAGAVTGGASSGPFAGASVGTITTSFWNSDVAVIADNSAGGTSATTAQMKDSTLFSAAGWDLTSTWLPTAGEYPSLR